MARTEYFDELVMNQRNLLQFQRSAQTKARIKNRAWLCPAGLYVDDAFVKSCQIAWEDERETFIYGNEGQINGDLEELARDIGFHPVDQTDAGKLAREVDLSTRRDDNLVSYRKKHDPDALAVWNVLRGGGFTNALKATNPSLG
jgi:hypothetical protein